MGGPEDGDDTGTDADDTGTDADDTDTGVAPSEFDPSGVDAADIDPLGAMIAVAFTGAVTGLVGAGISLFVTDLGLALIGVGVVVALSSPIAYLRHRRRYGS
ncbi:MAG: hypothetical protein R6U01_04405 [Halorubrum sp.]|uniref:hypothetical protein n=1 Tax=Halorubrum sp. TaxID=1879286 RepID=UPI00397069AC